MRLAPALSTRWMKGSFLASAISWQRNVFFRLDVVMAPAFMPLSSTMIIERAPLTKPMPAIMLPPGRLFSGSSLSLRYPVMLPISRNGMPGSKSRVKRSRGVSWPRSSKRGRRRSEACTARPFSSVSSLISAIMSARLAAKLSPPATVLDSKSVI